MYFNPKELSDPLLAAAVGTAIATPLLLFNIRLAPKLVLYDWPKARGITEERIPIVGYSLVILSVLFLAIGVKFFQLSSWFLVTSIIMALMGHFDDRRPLPPLDKMFFQMVCVLAIVFFDQRLNNALSQKFGPWGIIWGIFFITGLSNAINFIDGIDGLAGTVLSTGALGFILISFRKPEFFIYSTYCSFLIGALIPFLYLNIARRKGFLGNVGSYTLSYILAVMYLSFPIESSDPVSRLAIPGLCFVVPIADATMVLISRILTRRSPFQADKGHLHHRLVQTGIPLRNILYTFGTIQLSGVITAFFLFQVIQSNLGILPAIMCTALIFVSTLLILLIEKASKQRVQMFFEHLDQGDSLFFLKYKLQNKDGSPIPSYALSRLEAKLTCEIRVTDLCYLKDPDTILIALRTSPEPLKGIASRIATLFENERVLATLVVEQGEFVKIPHFQPEPSTIRAYSSH